MFHERSLAFAFALSCAVTVVSVSSEAHAAGEDCFRDTECAGSELCIDGTCDLGGALPSCTDNAGCPGFGAVCSDGFCKNDGVVCRNAGGACWVKNGSGQCACLDGNESGWVDGYNPDDPPVERTDAELQVACAETLVDDCGDSAPSLPDACVGGVLEHCEAYVAKEDALLQVCGEQVPSSPLARVGTCCLEHDDSHMASYRACVLDLDASACPDEAWNDCYGYEGDGTQEGDAASGGDRDADEASKKGCHLGRETPPVALLILLGLVTRLRRRRSS